MKHCNHFYKDGFVGVIIVKGGMGNLCEEKIDGVKIITKDMNWFICIIYITHFYNLMTAISFAWRMFCSPSNLSDIRSCLSGLKISYDVVYALQLLGLIWSGGKHNLSM